jgi:hypothetical protein
MTRQSLMIPLSRPGRSFKAYREILAEVKYCRLQNGQWPATSGQCNQVVDRVLGVGGRSSEVCLRNRRTIADVCMYLCSILGGFQTSVVEYEESRRRMEGSWTRRDGCDGELWIVADSGLRQIIEFRMPVNQATRPVQIARWLKKGLLTHHPTDRKDGANEASSRRTPPPKYLLQRCALFDMALW